MNAQYELELVNNTGTGQDALPNSQPTDQSVSPSEQESSNSIPFWPCFFLLVQHLSFSWWERSYEFAVPLYLVVLFPTTLVPASLLGIITTGTSLLGMGWVGGLVDTSGRLSFVQCAVIVQKACMVTSFTLFVVLYLPLRDATFTAWSSSPTMLTQSTSENSTKQHPLVYTVLAMIVICSSISGLASGGINTAIQRDWVTTIAAGNTSKLTVLNTRLRRVDLICKLLAPLFVSLLTTTASYPFSLYFQLCAVTGSVAYELVMVAYVYRRFPILAIGEDEKGIVQPIGPTRARTQRSIHILVHTVWIEIVQMCKDSIEFSRLPIFLSSISISLVYLTTLSFDGMMLSYLKSQRGLSDSFIAGMRGVAVIMGLVGTILMPWLERRVGLVRGGAWSLWLEIGCLAPALATLYVGLPSVSPPGRGETWNIVVFFLFISLSRIGLWSFDLMQLQALQEALQNHPKRNRLTSLQLSLQSAFDLLKYVVVLSFNKPMQFKWTGLISFVAVVLAGVVYTVFLWRTRGHVVHWARLRLGSSSTEDLSGHVREGHALRWRRMGLRFRRAPSIIVTTA